MKKLVSLIVIIAMMSGCATLESLPDDVWTRFQCTVTYTALGGSLGAIIGNLFGRNTESTLKGLAIGTIVSAIASSLYCKHVADKKKQYATEDQYLDACIAEARRVNAETLQYNGYLNSEIARLNSDLNNVNIRYRTSQSRRNELARLKNVAEKKHEEAAKKLVRAKSEVKIQQEVYKREQGQSQARLASLDNEISSLKQTVANLEYQAGQLAKIKYSISI